jgi:hypothetical protein
MNDAWFIHDHIKISKCRSCQAHIVWMKTEAGKNMPVDADSVDEGDDLFDPKKHVSHFSICPNADLHRRK